MVYEQRVIYRQYADTRLMQLRLALRNYEQDYGTLPPRYLSDKKGTPTHSWRTLVLRDGLRNHVNFSGANKLDRLVISEPWNSECNRKIIEAIPSRADWFARDFGFREQPPPHTCILALVGEDSIWDSKTGLPKGSTEKLPKAVLFVSVPESTIDPLEPSDITEDELRRRVENGQEVFFADAGEHPGTGMVRVKDGKLVFRTYEEERDDAETTHRDP
jgi:hypothetical protein